MSNYTYEIVEGVTPRFNRKASIMRFHDGDTWVGEIEWTEYFGHVVAYRGEVASELRGTDAFATLVKTVLSHLYSEGVNLHGPVQLNTQGSVPRVTLGDLTVECTPENKVTVASILSDWTPPI